MFAQMMKIALNAKKDITFLLGHVHLALKVVLHVQISQNANSARKDIS